MKASQRSLTRVDILVIVLIVLFVLLLFFWISFTPVHEEARKVNCRKNLYQIGKALAAYREDNGGYFPFSWQRAGEPEPVGDGSANAAMAATSLGNLYPRYVITTRIFKCPSAADEPSFVLNLPLAYRGAGQAAGLAGALPHGSNWTLTGDFPLLLTSMSPMRASSYGYDPRISPGAPDGDVVAVNGNNGDAVEITPAGRQVATVTLAHNGAGDLFGLTVAPGGKELLFVNDGTNALDVASVR